jgi:fatty-acid peroxygenase
MFTQEVRRFYPFFPAVGGRATEGFEWGGVRIDKGTLVLLDLYGTDHHPALWGDPEVFRPERFEGWHDNGYALVAQGGGDYLGGHRCAGEAVTIELVKSALHLLAARVRYRVPQQDLRISLARMPTLPASGFVLDSVRLVAGV